MESTRTLNESESYLLSTLAARGLTVFTIADARAVLDLPDAGLRKLLHRLNRKQWIARLKRGCYLLLPLAAGPEPHWTEHEYLIADALARPHSYYLAYGTALHYYGYTEQRPASITVATTERIRPRTFGGLTYRFIRLSAGKFFGYGPIRLSGREVQMAEREKAIADALDRPALAGGVLEAAKGLWFGSDELDWDKLLSYTLRLGNRVAARRLGFWLELLGLAQEPLLARLDVGRGHSYALLEPGGSPDGARNARWRLIVNVPEWQLLEWKEH